MVGAGRGHPDAAGAALRVRVGVGVEPHVRGDLRLDLDRKLQQTGKEKMENIESRMMRNSLELLDSLCCFRVSKVLLFKNYNK